MHFRGKAPTFRITAAPKPLRNIQQTPLKAHMVQGPPALRSPGNLLERKFQALPQTS